MNKLTLNQKSFLMDKILKTINADADDIWTLTDAITDGQYRYLLALCYNGQTNELKSEVDKLIIYAKGLTREGK
jgi:hypothetical protein